MIRALVALLAIAGALVLLLLAPPIVLAWVGLSFILVGAFGLGSLVGYRRGEAEGYGQGWLGACREMRRERERERKLDWSEPATAERS